jgi:hypothetical protein
MSTKARQSPRTPSLWPREHGAYMQLLFPVASAWILGWPSVAAVCLGLAAVVVFIAHEPLLVLIGRRGARRRRAQGGAAAVRLATLGTLAVALGAVGLWFADPTARGLTLVPLIVGVPAVALALTGHERSLAGELYLGLLFALIALPVATAAGMVPTDAALLAGAWTAGFWVGTIAARGILLQKRDGGRGLRAAAGAAVTVAVGSIALAASGLVPVAFALAPLPFVAVALALALKPPPPRRMMAIGFTLLGACVATTLLLVAAGARADATHTPTPDTGAFHEADRHAAHRA